MLQSMADEAGMAIDAAAGKLHAGKPAEAVKPQTDVVEKFNQMYRYVAPYPNLVGRAVATQQRLVDVNTPPGETRGERDGKKGRGKKAVAKVREALTHYTRTVYILVRQINIAVGDVYLLSRRAEIQECGSDIIINLVANVFCFRLALSQGRFRLRDFTFNPAAREDGNTDSRLHIEVWVQVGEGGGKLSVTAIGHEHGITFTPGGGKRLLGSFHNPHGRL